MGAMEAESFISFAFIFLASCLLSELEISLFFCPFSRQFFLYCMAANSKGRAIAGSFGKQLANQIWAAAKAEDLRSFSSACSLRRVAHYSSSYAKNVEEHVRPALVPDHVTASESDKYWGPNPKTGVFGPADGAGDHAAGGLRGAASAGDGPSSVLDQTVWFRPLEDVEKPPPQD